MEGNPCNCCDCIVEIAPAVILAVYMEVVSLDEVLVKLLLCVHFAVTLMAQRGLIVMTWW